MTDLHIISLDIPYPADYGGVIDIYYKLKALHALGVRITLHCFEYGNRKPQPILQTFCEKVYYYPRITGIGGWHLYLPYIVSSRQSDLLLQRLLADEAPILMEGLHTTFVLSHPDLQHRKKIVRAHNIEHSYYQQLANYSNSFLKKLYYQIESKRLFKYEKILSHAQHVLSISLTDKAYFSHQYPQAKHLYLPAFHGHSGVTGIPGTGSYGLYHGNLSVPENKAAVKWLVQEVWSHIQVPLIIAGKNPDAEITSFANDKIRVIANPSNEEMLSYIQEAHLLLMPAMQVSGVKLKLLDSLFIGRHCLVNQAMLTGTQIKNSVNVATHINEWITTIQTLMNEPFTHEHIQIRTQELLPYQDEILAQQLIHHTGIVMQ